MAKRLYFVGLLALALACRSNRSETTEGNVANGSPERVEVMEFDSTEKALRSLGIDGRVMRFDLNTGKWEGGRARITQVHLLSGLMLLEGSGEKPHVFAVRRNGLELKWYSPLMEPSAFAASENGDTVFLVSAHYLHALDAGSGRPTMRFAGGSLAGLSRPALKLPFTPTGGAAGQSDTAYVPGLGSPQNNKTLESFSLVVGQRGWGYRTSGDIMTAPIVGGSAGDPKLYFVTTTGLLTCMDATNYGFAPGGARWQELLEAAVRYGLAVTADRKGAPGAVYAVDSEGVVYCLDRITGERRWTNATGREAAGAPHIFGEICVVRMKSGLSGFDKDGVIYAVTPSNGRTAGVTHWIRAGENVTAGGMSLEIAGEVLYATASGDATLIVNGESGGKRAAVRNGDQVQVGGIHYKVVDWGNRALWHDLPYERVVGKVGHKLIAANGNTLAVVNAWTGEPMGEPVTVPGARLIPRNTSDADLFVIGGDAVVYALLAR